MQLDGDSLGSGIEEAHVLNEDRRPRPMSISRSLNADATTQVETLRKRSRDEEEQYYGQKWKKNTDKMATNDGVSEVSERASECSGGREQSEQSRASARVSNARE